MGPERGLMPLRMIMASRSQPQISNDITQAPAHCSQLARGSLTTQGEKSEKSLIGPVSIILFGSAITPWTKFWDRDFRILEHPYSLLTWGHSCEMEWNGVSRWWGDPHSQGKSSWMLIIQAKEHPLRTCTSVTDQFENWWYSFQFLSLSYQSQACALNTTKPSTDVFAHMPVLRCLLWYAWLMHLFFWTCALCVLPGLWG